METAQLVDVFPDLVKVCLGEVKADLVLKDCCLVNVASGELLEDVDITVKRRRIAYVGSSADHTIGGSTKVLSVKGGFVAPGFIDAHTHIDLFCTPTEQTSIFLIHGTTAVFAEPDELVSVLGFKGLELFADEVRRLPLRVFMMVPLVTPQDPELSSIKPLTLEEYEYALTWPDVVGLGEAVAWPLILKCNSYYLERFRLALKRGKVIEGHTAGAKNLKLVACACSGISSCHEPVDADQALARLRLGLFLMVREGSLRRDLTAILPALLKRKVDLSNAAFATDWVDPVDLTELGYMDYVVKEAVEHGLDPVKAIQMATINPAKHFRVDDQVGLVAPGRLADLVVLKSLEKVEVSMTVVGGEVMVKNGRFTGKLEKPHYPEYALKTMKVPRRLEASDFEVRAPVEEGAVKVVVAKLENEAITRKTVEGLKAVNGLIQADVKLDVAKVAVIDRHYGTGRVGLGFIKGFGARVGAISTSLNFDENNLVVLGFNEEDMELAANETVRMGGGLVVVNGGRVVEALPMPVAGVMSDEPFEGVTAKLRRINRLLRDAGCAFKKPINVLLFTTFVALPEVRFTDRGIVDVKERRFIPLIVEP